MLQEVFLKSLNALFGECVIPALVEVGLNFLREDLRGNALADVNATIDFRGF